MFRIQLLQAGRLLRRPLLICCALPLLGGCDPCFGVGSCGTPQIRYSGQLLSAWNGEPLAGLRLELHQRASGSKSELLVAYTDSAGRFTLAGRAEGPGMLDGVLEVYQLDSLLVDTLHMRLAITRTPADLRELGSLMVSHIHFESYGHIYDRASGAPLPDVEIEFHRTGGIEIDPEIYRATADRYGNFPLRPEPLASGEVVGDLIIRPPPPRESRIIREFSFSTTLGPDPNPLVARWGVGPQLPYLGRVVWSDDGLGAAGVEVEVRRISGIQVDPDVYQTTTDDWGVFHLAPRPLDTGEVTFLLSFLPAGATDTTSYEYSLRTTEEDVSNVVTETWVIPRP